MEAALAEGARHGPFDFILYSGDSQRHDMGEATNDTWAGLASVLNTTRELMAAAFPGTAVQMLPSPVMGNNDFVPDYSVDASPQFREYKLITTELINTLKQGLKSDE